MDQIPTCNTKNDKTLRRKWEKPRDTDFVNDPLDTTPKAQATKQKTDDFTQMLSCHTAKNTTSRVKRQPIRVRENI